jgi:hypothetical protein
MKCCENAAISDTLNLILSPFSPSLPYKSLMNHRRMNGTGERSKNIRRHAYINEEREESQSKRDRRGVSDKEMGIRELFLLLVAKCR